MTAKGASGCSCGPCYVTGTCDDCLKCYPHFICVRMQAKAGADVCCGDIDVVMYYRCKGSWSGSTICGGVTHTFSAEVIEDDYGNCYFLVYYNDDVISEALIENREIPGLDADLDYDYTISIGAGAGYRNPQAFNSCGSCKCARCAPQSFCVRVDVTPLTQYGLCDECHASGTLLCNGGGYSGMISCGRHDFSISMSPIPDTCSMRLVIASGDDQKEVFYSSEVLIQPQDDANGHECRHGPDFSITRGVVGGGNTDVIGVSTDPFEVEMDLDGGASQALFLFTPKWCGSCPPPVSTACPGGCAGISTTCDPYCGSTTLYGQIMADGCEMDGKEFTLRSCYAIYGVDRNTNWPASPTLVCQQHVVYETDPYLGVKTNRTYYGCIGTTPNATFFTAELYYRPKSDCPDLTVDFSRYVLNIAFYAACSGPPPTPYAQGMQLTPVSGSCSPFRLDFEFTPPTMVGPCACCHGGSGSNTIRITE